MDVVKFKLQPVMGILRGVELQAIEPLMEAIIAAGLETIEITMNTQGAPELIQKALKVCRGRLTIGAGTVLTVKDALTARDAGATFMVMPTLVKEVVSYCLKNALPVFPGALSPQEIYNAWNEGATMVKVFPAKCFGPEYFKEIKGPFNQVKLLACGGVTPQNLQSYFSYGADAVSFGASVFKKEWLEKKDFKSIALSITAYLQQLPHH
jgi:2-dehydro-3-deoxyphosphogluconate aldolase/(4S)-4-hydroxy-2-oxoglutarate aldolase